MEVGIGFGVKMRANSWYDGGLVTRLGEDILASIDSKGIEELRRHRLVWSGWTLDDRLSSDDLTPPGDHAGFRVVQIARPAVLQLFFLSLLWRAGASTRPEFKVVALDDDVLENIRQRVLSQDPGAFEDYQIQLFQLITRGVMHNRTPLLERKHTCNLDGSFGTEVSYVRFYFDGLVAHIHLGVGIQFTAEYLSTCMRLEEATTVFAHEFEDSRTAANIREMVEVVEKDRMTIDMPVSSIAAAVREAWSRKDR